MCLFQGLSQSYHIIHRIGLLKWVGLRLGFGSRFLGGGRYFVSVVFRYLCLFLSFWGLWYLSIVGMGLFVCIFVCGKCVSWLFYLLLVLDLFFYPWVGGREGVCNGMIDWLIGLGLNNDVKPACVHVCSLGLFTLLPTGVEILLYLLNWLGYCS